MLDLPAPVNGEGQPKQPHHRSISARDIREPRPCGGAFLFHMSRKPSTVRKGVTTPMQIS